MLPQDICPVVFIAALSTIAKKWNQLRQTSSWCMENIVLLWSSKPPGKDLLQIILDKFIKAASMPQSLSAVQRQVKEIFGF